MRSCIIAALLVTMGVCAAAQEQEGVQTVKSKQAVPIRSSPPTPWLLGFPGWEVGETSEGEEYRLVSRQAFRAGHVRQVWAELSYTDPEHDVTRTGWVYWGKSLSDDHNFVDVPAGGRASGAASKSGE